MTAWWAAAVPMRAGIVGVQGSCDGDPLGTALTIVPAMGLATGIRSRLDRVRDVQWGHEIRRFQEDVGRANQR